MALVQWARGGRARQIWIHYCGVGMNQVYLLWLYFLWPYLLWLYLL